MIIIIIFYAKNLIKKIQLQIKDIAFGIKNCHLLQAENINKEHRKNIYIKYDKLEKKSKKQKVKLKYNNDKKQISKFTSKKMTILKKIVLQEKKKI